MKAGSTPELAAKAGLHRTIPDSIATIDVGTSEGSDELAAYAGLWIFLRSRVGATTFLRSSSSPTLVANVGPTLAEGVTSEEFFVDPAGEMTLFHIGDNASGKLDVYYDSEQAG